MLMAGDKNAIFVEVNKAIEAVMVKVRVLQAEVAILKAEKAPKVKEKVDSGK